MGLLGMQLEVRMVVFALVERDSMFALIVIDVGGLLPIVGLIVAFEEFSSDRRLQYSFASIYPMLDRTENHSPSHCRSTHAVEIGGRGMRLARGEEACKTLDRWAARGRCLRLA